MNRFDDEEDEADRIPIVYTIAITLSIWLAIGGVIWAVYKGGGGQ